MALSNNDKRHLRGLAHDMAPIARIGSKRVTEAMVAHVDELLESKELVKLRLLDADKDEVEEARDALVEGTGAELVQLIGGTLVLFRRRAQEPEIRMPGERPFAHQRRREAANKANTRKPRRATKPKRR
jgi:RNA-binding protein